MATARPVSARHHIDLLTRERNQRRQPANPPAPATTASQLLANHFRCSSDLARWEYRVDPLQASGYFRFGPGLTCYGRCSSGTPLESVTDSLHDALPYVTTNGTAVELPFDPIQAVESLRCERYVGSAVGTSYGKKAVRSLYYFLRPLMPVAIRQHLQRIHLRGWDEIPFPRWPVDRTADSLLERLLVLAMKARGIEKIPFIWFWPSGARSCAIVTHDVETAAGVDFCSQLMDLNDSFDIKTSFQIVPERRYTVEQSFLENIRQRGFEVNIHDLDHDGHLFDEYNEFRRRAERINDYGKRFGAQGFRSAVLYRNTDWFDALDFSYDMSIPSVAHLDPQRGGCCTLFPYFIGKILELPLTMVQDYSLFHILNEYSISRWKEQISLIRKCHGLMSLIIHPDYIIERRARRVYAELLQYLSGLRSQGETWLALPGEVAAWWRQRSEMNLVNDGGTWRIAGPGRERATVAYAVLAGDELTYDVEPPC